MSYDTERASRLQAANSATDLRDAGHRFLETSFKYKYSYNFAWLDRPIIQYPQDVVAMQELIWELDPDLVIETGVAHGGSLILYASLMLLRQLERYPDRPARELMRETSVLGLEIDFRDANREALRHHFLAPMIKVVNGSSLADSVYQQVCDVASGRKRVLVVLDSNHTAEHVRQELELYAPLVSNGSYCVVFDTLVETLSPELFRDRPWGPGDSPATAIADFLEQHPEFSRDSDRDAQLVFSAAGGGYLRRAGA